MIDKMMKYSFILLSEETEGFLEEIQELGVVDITRSNKPVDAQSSAMLDNAATLKKVTGILEKIDYSKDPDVQAIVDAAGKTTFTDDPVKSTLDAVGRLDSLNASLSGLEREVKSRKAWGEFDAQAINGLEERGYKVRFYTVPSKKFQDEWMSLYPLQIISQDKSNTWFVTVTPAGEECALPVDPIEAPSRSWKEAQAEIESVRQEIISTKGLLLKLKEKAAEVNAEYCSRLTELDLYLADVTRVKAAEEMVTLFEGFAPVENEAEVTAKLDSMGVFYIKAEATEIDNPPIKLKNNRFSRMFEVMTGMYGMPGYAEWDPTPVLAPFFLLFFAMCMGDAGYGLVLILFGIGVSRKWINIDMFKNIGPLISVLGIATFFVGVILGTAFGIPLAEQAWIPDSLKSIMITGEIAGYSAQMVLAIGIGVFHICLAMIIKAVSYTLRFGFKENISTWGWLVLILGGIIIAAMALLGVMNANVTKWAIIVVGTVSALGIFIFNTPGRNPLMNIGAGLWDTYNMVTGLMGDVLSYIRLYALGLAGGMLGAAFNDLGLMVLGDGGVKWVFFILILLIGHVLNLAMSCLGAFVHPLRLTFVEYFKNSGYEGKGVAYNPLKKQDASN